MQLVNVATATLCAAGVVLGEQQQQQQQPPTFRSSVQLVEVDVIVTDRQGRFVPGLTADDLEIYEDGQLQDVEVFYLVAREPLRAPAGGGDDDPAPAAPRHEERVFIFLFDEGHLTNEAVQRLKRAAREFITTQFASGDVGGLFHGGRMANGRLTTSQTELVFALRAVQPEPETRASRLALFRDFPRIEGEYEAARIEAGDTRTLANAAQQNCEDDPDQCRLEGGLDLVESSLEQKARQYIAEARAATSRTLRTLTVVIGGLARIPGRKTLVLLTEGFFVDESRSAVQQIAAQAARSGVTIYSVDARGTREAGGRALPDAASTGAPISTAFDTAEDGAEILAANTGGLVVRGSDDFTRAFERIADDTSTYYVLGYAPATQKLDGSLRKIEVRAKRGGLQIRARKAYLATPLPTRKAPGGRR